MLGSFEKGAFTVRKPMHGKPPSDGMKSTCRRTVTYVQAHMHGERKKYEEQQQTTDQQWM